MFETNYMIVDGNSLLVRSYFATNYMVKEPNDVTKVYTNAVVLFNSYITDLVENFHPDKILVAWDTGKGNFRQDIIDHYKGTRNKQDLALIGQYSIAEELLDAYGISQYKLDNYEADDIIGTVTKMISDNGDKATIVSGDKDMIQLIDDNVELWQTKKGVSDINLYNMDTFSSVFNNMSTDQFIQYKAIRGDSSDNYHGINGIGPKGAIKLLEQFGSIDNLYIEDNLNQMSNSIRNKVLSGKNDVYTSLNLATIRRDAPIDFTLDDINDTYLKYSNLPKFLDKYDLQISNRRIKFQTL